MRCHGGPVFIQQHAIAVTGISKIFCRRRKPEIAGSISDDIGALVEHNDPIANGRRAAIDQPQRIGNREAVQTRHQINVIVRMTEWLGRRQRPISKKVRVRDATIGGNSQPQQFAIEQRELRIDAGHGPAESRGPAHPQWNAFGQHDIQDTVLRAPTCEPERDGALDLRVECRAIDVVKDGGAYPHDVVGRDFSSRQVMSRYLLRFRARFVHDNEHIAAVLRKQARGGEGHNRSHQNANFHTHALLIISMWRAGRPIQKCKWDSEMGGN